MNIVLEKPTLLHVSRQRCLPNYFAKRNLTDACESDASDAWNLGQHEEKERKRHISHHLKTLH